MHTGLTDLISTRTESYHHQAVPATLSDILHEGRKQKGNVPEKTACEILATAPTLGAALSSRVRELAMQEGGSPRNHSPRSRERMRTAANLYRQTVERNSLPKASVVHCGKSVAEIVETYTSALPANIVRIMEYHRKQGIARQEAFLKETLSPATETGKPSFPESPRSRGSIASLESPRSSGGSRSGNRRNAKRLTAARGFKCAAFETDPSETTNWFGLGYQPSQSSGIVPASQENHSRDTPRDSPRIVRPSTAPTTRPVVGISSEGTAQPEKEVSKRSTIIATPRASERRASPVTERRASPTQFDVKRAEQASKAGLSALRRALEAKQKVQQRGRLERAAGSEIPSLKKRMSKQTEHLDNVGDTKELSEVVKPAQVAPPDAASLTFRRAFHEPPPSIPSIAQRGFEGFRLTRPIVPQRSGVDFVIPEAQLLKSKKVKSAKFASQTSASTPKYTSTTSRRGDVTRDELEPVQVTVVSYSSQRDNGRHAASNLAHAEPGTVWESLAPPDQALVFDIGCEREICGLVLRCSGTKADPKDVIIMRGLTLDGPWVTARRIFVNAGSKNRETQKHDFLFDSGGECRFWKLLIKDNWGASNHVSIVAPLTFLARCPPVEENEEDDRLMLDVPDFRHAYGLEVFFSEALTLSAEDQEVRSVARKHDIPLHTAEKIRDEFRRYASAGRTLNYGGFSKLIHTVVTRSAAGNATTKFDESVDIPESRVWTMWNEIDQDRSHIDFENFLLWFYHMFHCSPLCASSQHSNREANTLTERFYDGLGRGRIRKYLQKQEYLEELEREEDH